MEERLYNLLKSEREVLKAILEYFSLKNKTLWEGSTNWQSGTKTIPGIYKYKTILVYPWTDRNGIELERHNDTTFMGEGMVAYVSTTASLHTSIGYMLYVNENDATSISYEVYMHHSGGSNHSSYGTAWIKKIVGKEPLLPDALKNIIGGGCAKLGGGAVATVSALKRHYSRHKGYIEQVLYHIRRCYGYIQNVIYGMHAYRFAERCISRFGANRRKCGYLCYNERRPSGEFDYVRTRARLHERRWWSTHMGLAVGRGRRLKLCETHNIPILLRLGDIFRQTCRYPSDLTDWGCAA